MEVEVRPLPPDKPASRELSSTTDFVAGWLGGALGILICNPLEVYKIRLQTSVPSSSRVGSGRLPASLPHQQSLTSSGEISSRVLLSQSTPIASGTSATLTAARASVRPTLRALWEQEGWRFLTAGAAAPILGLAFIDSAFFGIYGRAMSQLSQDRQDPAMLSRVFVAGATAGACCALLQTPVEVVKCAAQAEPKPPPGRTALGTFGIARMIFARDGLRGFYVGGLVTGVRDSISSGIFFWAYFAIRRTLRGDKAFEPSPTSSAQDSPASPTSPAELGRILLSGAIAGTLAAVVPYPLDIVKTRLQVAGAQPHAPNQAPKLSIRQVANQIYRESQQARSSGYTHNRTSWMFRLANLRYPTNELNRQQLYARITGLKGLARGLKPTMVSSAAGSAVTIGVFEVACYMLSQQNVAV
ncbi:uncharacterized protein L969DRAFT_92957 [Mixia osmundae IAM 14324]|uniref:Mitochondrial carrier n=1 Tax=Mixia osmundae (strain CBS 9802 / IAM 14324 / JCM 22182 / KY 12970) TaxID=764103 RepID=G7DTW5_MIXOS|nr:uncharacterized protein L969DRAFT_92957 [Mixia osmundae IAM 14324]KEI41738.1 hypothetical protein L969DRAFT_92957 [Mixia osmundae IAM 14324]GAA94025.1 hypothetical protein E5Q_00672 [Mixia osmundae IAM 14324]